MTNTELEQVVTTLQNLGFKVEWVDIKAETLLIRAMPVRR